MSDLLTGKIGQVMSTHSSPTLDLVEVRLDAGKTVRSGQFLYALLEGVEEAPSHITMLRVSSAREWSLSESLESQQDLRLPSLRPSRDRGESQKRLTVATTVPIESIRKSPPNGYTHEEPVFIVPSGSAVYDNLQGKIVNVIANEVLGFAPPGFLGMIGIGTTLGTQRIPVTLSANHVLPRNILIIGSAGTGKSWALGKITEELHRIGIRHVNLDVHGELNAATAQLGGDNLVPGKDLTFRLSSLDEQEILSMIPVADRFHKDIITKAISDLKAQRVAFNIDRLKEEAGNVGASCGVRQNVREIIEAKISQLGKASIIGSGFDWKVALAMDGCLINIDCRQMHRRQLMIIAGALTRELHSLRNNGEIKPLVLSIDEAHLFLPSGESLSPFAPLSELIRMGRHIAMGVILVTQSPEDLDRHIAKITSTRMIFAIEPTELSSIEGLLVDTPEELFKSIPRMSTGTCLLVGSRETVKHATVVKIGERTTKHGGTALKMIESPLESPTVDKGDTTNDLEVRWQD